MTLRLSALAFVLASAQAFVGTAAGETRIRQENVHFAKGGSSAVIKGQLNGDAMVDYIVGAAAGQTLSVQLQRTNAQNYFNVMPPGSTGSAMFVGDSGGNYSGMLPADGDYVVRVYLMRPAARRGESSEYTLAIEVTGEPLSPIEPSQDAHVPGTSYHAAAKIKCVPPFEATPRDCDAFVIRRGLDGTATVEVPSSIEKRSMLFVKGRPVASNASATAAMTSTRIADLTIVRIGEVERYEIPDALIAGG